MKEVEVEEVRQLLVLTDLIPLILEAQVDLVEQELHQVLMEHQLQEEVVEVVEQQILLELLEQVD